MTCSRSASGQSLCQIVPHPDRPQESFCITCNRRFISQEPNQANTPASNDQSPGFWPLLAGVYAVVFILAMTSSDPPPIPQPQNAASQVTSQLTPVKFELLHASLLRS